MNVRQLIATLSDMDLDKEVYIRMWGLRTIHEAPERTVEIEGEFFTPVDFAENLIVQHKEKEAA